MKAERTAATGWPLRRWFLTLVVVMVGVLAIAVTVGAVALNSLTQARALVVDQVDPASRQALVLSNALLDEETGVRGYVLNRNKDFLQPFVDGQRDEAAAVAALRTLFVGDLAGSTGTLDEIVSAADAWRTQYAQPAISQGTTGDADRGKALFDKVRAGLTTQENRLTEVRTSARTALSDAGSQLVVVGLILAVVLLALALGLAILLQLGVIAPVSKLAEEVRQVADGQFGREVAGTGPREIVGLAEDVDLMRLHIVAEVDTLKNLHAELARSNTELEQFAYVASHDLQEPLRKIASFCQLLERRYAGQLDDRADQYIGFAVDGAKRMQVLINDLLAFSRVGRVTREQVVVDCGSVVEQAMADLAEAIEESGAEITVGELPSVRGEVSLLTAVFQNLIGNAVKFHGEQPPRISVSAEPTGGYWTFAVTDNGLGIEPEYAERIFVIFQRLHAKDAYPGTGIGLAMVRKIIEFHGGRIWLDGGNGSGAGTTFRFTLPVVEEDEERDALS